jgi:hypothetical protein
VADSPFTNQAIPLLKLQVNAIVDLSNRSRGINDLWGDETVKEILREIVEQGSQHISKVCRHDSTLSTDG